MLVLSYSSDGVKDSSEQGLLLVLGFQLITNLVRERCLASNFWGILHVVHDVWHKITWVHVSRLSGATPKD